MGVNYIKIISILVISKNCKFCSEIKFEMENVEHLRWKVKKLKIMSDFKLEIDDIFNLFFYFCERITKTS